MFKNKINISFLILLFLFLFYLFGISPKCKNQLIYKNVNILFSSYCVNSSSIKENSKLLLSKNEFAYKFSQKIYANYLSKYFKKDVLSEINNNLILENLFPKKMDIQGLINNEEELKRLSIKSKEKKNFKNWHRSHGNNYNNKFLETINLNKNNISDLKLLKIFDTTKNSFLQNDWKSKIGINPIYADGKIFFVSASMELVVLSADDFSLIWSKKFDSSISRRGFLYHKDTNFNQGYLFINSGSYLYKINANNGNLIKKFGDNGSSDVGIVQIPPVVYKNEVIISSVIDSEIVSLDYFTGKKNYSVKINKNDVYANPWGGAALDEKNGLYFTVVGNPKPGTLGINRPGENKNANSIIAFDIEKKKIIWTFQEVIHDLWDFDLSAPPILADIKIKNFIIPSVIVTTKTGNTYVFERTTGKSVFDINYKSTISSDIPNEVTSPLQPKPIKPKSFSKINFEMEDLRKNLSQDENFLKEFEQNNIFGWYQPPSIGKNVVFYGVKGGNNWWGSAYDPINQNLFIPANHIPYKIRTFVKSSERKNSGYEKLNFYKLYENKCSSCHGITRNGKYEKKQGYDILKNYVPSLVGLTSLDQLKYKFKSYSDLKKKHIGKLNLTQEEYLKIVNLFKKWDRKVIKDNNLYFDSDWEEFFADDGELISSPPWGSLTSINLNNGNTEWTKPFGYFNGKETGTFNSGGTSLTSSGLMVSTGTIDKFLTIKDQTNGETLWTYEMDAEGTAAPLIYNHNNKSYIAVIATGGLYPDSNRESLLYIFGTTN